MAFEKPISISVDALSDLVSKTVEEAGIRADPDDTRGGLVRRLDPWIIGYILRDLNRLSDVNVATLGKMADRVSASIDGPTSAAVLIRDGQITVGFFPEIDAFAFDR
jgi:hypothetical protein